MYTGLNFFRNWYIICPLQKGCKGIATLQCKCFTVSDFGRCCKYVMHEQMFINNWNEAEQTKQARFILSAVNTRNTLHFPCCPNLTWFRKVGANNSLSERITSSWLILMLLFYLTSLWLVCTLCRVLFCLHVCASRYCTSESVGGILRRVTAGGLMPSGMKQTEREAAVAMVTLLCGSLSGEAKSQPAERTRAERCETELTY